MQIPSRLPTIENRAADGAGPVPLRALSAKWPQPRHGQGNDHGGPAESYVGILLGRIWNSAWTLLVLGNVFWASNIIVGRAILGDVPAIALSFWRWTGAFAVAIWFAWPHLKKDWPLLLADWKIMLALGA